LNPSSNFDNIDSEIDVYISLHQKFKEPNTLDIIVEVLEEDVELGQINRRNYEP
jgi:hypothetical protein